jgi:hypothetical protein
VGSTPTLGTSLLSPSGFGEHSSFRDLPTPTPAYDLPSLRAAGRSQKRVHHPVPKPRFFRFLRFLAGDIGAGLGLAAVVALIWTWHHDAWSMDAWRSPMDYQGDSHEVLARVKAAAEGDTWPLREQVISRLGAPWGAVWSEYPTTDKILLLILGGMTHLVGLGMAANLALVLAAISSAWAFFFAVRRLGASLEWAFAGALLFAFSCAILQRGLPHLLLLYTWTLPLGLLACAYIARSARLTWRAPEAIVCLAAALGLGVSNPYHLFFWGQLLAWAMVIRCLRRPGSGPLGVGLASGLIAVAALFFTHSETWLFSQDGALPLLVRNYGGTEMYALKPIELFVPPGEHRWDWFRFFGERYSRWSAWRGEAYLPYLGLVGIFAFIWLITESVGRVIRGRAPSGWALQIGWLLAYSTVGGITNLLALYTGFNLFRATNRASVFIACIVLLFLAVRLTSVLRTRPALSWSAAALLTIVGLFDQIPRSLAPASRDQVRARVAADARFGVELERMVGKDGMVFQLPILGFPEVVPPHKMADYEHFRPYLHTSTLRFSYGAPKSRSRLRWQRELESASASELVKHLEAAGFAALYINRRGFEDGGDRLIAELSDLGYTTRIEGELREQVAVRLRPTPDPTPPLGRSFTFGIGWYPQSVEDHGIAVRWSHSSAQLSYFNPYPNPMQAQIHLRLSAPSERRLSLVLNRRKLTNFILSAQPTDLPVITATLQPGVNKFWLVTGDAPVKVDAPAARFRAIGLHEASIVPLVGQTSARNP